MRRKYYLIFKINIPFFEIQYYNVSQNAIFLILEVILMGERKTIYESPLDQDISRRELKKIRFLYRWFSK